MATSLRGIRLLAVALAILPATPVVAAAGHDQAQRPASPAYTRAEARYDVPDVTLVDMNGAKVSLRSELDAGRPVVVNFIFTSCTAICPVMSATFGQVQQALGRDGQKPRIVSISIDPEYDTPARLREYAARLNAGPEWHLLTGSKETILTVARAFDAWKGDKMNHAPTTYLRPPQGKAWVRLDGFASPAEIVREYRSLVDTRLSALAR
jgi:protein SCO1/2